MEELYKIHEEARQRGLKMVVVGDGAVGKTAIIFSMNDVIEGLCPTVFDDVPKVRFSSLEKRGNCFGVNEADRNSRIRFSIEPDEDMKMFQTAMHAAYIESSAGIERDFLDRVMESNVLARMIDKPYQKQVPLDIECDYDSMNLGFVSQIHQGVDSMPADHRRLWTSNLMGHMSSMEDIHHLPSFCSEPANAFSYRDSTSYSCDNVSFTRRDVVSEKQQRRANQQRFLHAEKKTTGSRAPVKYAERKCVGRQNYNFKK